MTEQLCAMCGAPKSEHAESRPDGAPAPRNGCGSLLRYFRPKTPAPTTRWIKLKRGNDWGVVYFAIEPLGSAGTASHSRGIKPEQSERIEVRVADGEVLVAAVHHREGQRFASDMGRDYTFRTMTPFVAISFHGQTANFEFDQVEVDEDWARSKGAQ